MKAPPGTGRFDASVSVTPQQARASAMLSYRFQRQMALYGEAAITTPIRAFQPEYSLHAGFRGEF